MANEIVLNGYLADILDPDGVIAEAEVKQADGSQIDVRCEVGDFVVAIEAEFGTSSTKKKAAIKDADDKIERGVCDIAIAVVYPGTVRTRTQLANTQVLVCVRTPGLKDSKSKANWIPVNVNGLIDTVFEAPNELGSPDELARIATIAVNRASVVFTEAECKSIMATMGKAVENTNVNGLMTDLLTAIMFHSNLDTIRHEMNPIFDQHSEFSRSFVEEWPPKTVRECLQTGILAHSFHEAHDMWLSVDYKQIFEWSCAILNSLPSSIRSNQAIRIIAEAALDLQHKSGSQHHDLVGITFCQSIESAKFDGSMYTTLPAATLLVNLLFEGLRIDWRDYDAVVGLRLVDFACGTGTLLIAAANYVLRHEQTGRSADVARAMLEQMLYGFDINNRGVFQTATGIGMIAPGVAFQKMHLYSLLLGVDSETEEAKLGSLEMLEGKQQLIFNPRPVTGTRVDAEPAPIESETFDIAIMNPPFTVSYKRHKQFDENTIAMLRDREATLFSDLPNDASSNANGFFVLVEKTLDKKDGRLGFVVPSSTTTAPSARNIRRFLANAFHVEQLVVTYDPVRFFMSGNTKIGEMLVILERKRSNESRPTKVVKVTSNPDSAVKATIVADSIVNDSIYADRHGVVDYVDRATIESGDWAAIQFVDNALSRLASKNVWEGTVGNQLILGPMGRPIRNWHKCRKADTHAVPTLYDHDVKHCDRIEVPPDQYRRPSKGPSKYEGTYLHLPERINWPTVKVVACRTNVKAVGSAWTCASVVPINGIEDEVLEKAVVMLLNSTPGKLGMLLRRTNRKPAYTPFSKEGLEDIPLPRLTQMDPNSLMALADVYDEFADQEKLSFRQAHLCSVQIAIDNAVCEHTAYDNDVCERARHLLAQEPTVTGKPYEFDPSAQQTLI